MPVLNPEHLLDQAALLANRPHGGRHRQADLRRAISTAYYAVFHTVSTAAADLVAGRGKRATARYALVYRGIDHRTLRAHCAIAARRVLPARFGDCVPNGGFGDGIRTFAGLVIDLQAERHRADYDPAWTVKPFEAADLVRFAREAIGHWNGAALDEREAFLTLMLFPPR